MKIKHKHAAIKSEERTCSNCIHANRVDEITLECDAEVYDVKHLTCFEAREEKTTE